MEGNGTYGLFSCLESESEVFAGWQQKLNAGVKTSLLVNLMQTSLLKMVDVKLCCFVS
jgi:hypothetical protein